MLLRCDGNDFTVEQTSRPNQVWMPDTPFMLVAYPNCRPLDWALSPARLCRESNWFPCIGDAPFCFYNVFSPEATVHLIFSRRVTRDLPCLLNKKWEVQPFDCLCTFFINWLVSSRCSASGFGNNRNASRRLS